MSGKCLFPCQICTVCLIYRVVRGKGKAENTLTYKVLKVMYRVHNQFVWLGRKIFAFAIFFWRHVSSILGEVWKHVRRGLGERWARTNLAWQDWDWDFTHTGPKFEFETETFHLQYQNLILRLRLSLIGLTTWDQDFILGSGLKGWDWDLD